MPGSYPPKPTPEVGEVFDVKFGMSREGDPMVRINGIVAFIDRRETKTAKPGQRWKIEIVGSNPSGKTLFVALVEPIRYIPRQSRRQPTWLDVDDIGSGETEGPAWDQPEYGNGWYYPHIEGLDRQESYDDVDFDELYNSAVVSAFDDDSPVIDPDIWSDINCGDDEDCFAYVNNHRTVTARWFAAHRGQHDSYAAVT